jgi:hypothetical protein
MTDSVFFESKFRVVVEMTQLATPALRVVRTIRKYAIRTWYLNIDQIEHPIISLIFDKTCSDNFSGKCAVNETDFSPVKIARINRVIVTIVKDSAHTLSPLVHVAY